MKRSREEAEKIVEELLRPDDNQDTDPPLLAFGFGSQSHKEMMEELFPEVAATMPLQERQLFCRHCGHRDDRWYSAYCPRCGKSLTK